MRPAVLAAIGSLILASPLQAQITGDVRDAAGPVAGARVRVQGECTFAISDKRGHFRLSSPATTGRVTAWKDGYAIAAAPLAKPLLQLALIRLPAEDNPEYEWIEPGPDPKRVNDCANC